MDLTGLTTEEVNERISKGEVNSVEQVVSRTYKDIIFKNVFTAFNIILFALGAILICFQEYINALAATFVICLSVTVATIQEVRAKRRLDKIALLMRPKVVVIRDSKECEIDQTEVVKDDIIKLSSGDQALVDGTLLESEYLEMDESLLTGESHTVRKKEADRIFSGSYCVTGIGYYRVDAFGESTFASEMLSSAKQFKKKKTPLQMETTAVTELLVFVSIIFMILMIIINLIKHFDSSVLVTTIVNNAVIVLDIVPVALLLLIVIAYMVSAVRMADTGVLLQNSNSIEALSHVNVVCMDKTGTITTNRLNYREEIQYVEDADEIAKLFANATGSKNRTVEALIKKFGEADVKPLDEIRFTSERKYSAVKLTYNGKPITIYSGAYSALRDNLDRQDVKDVIDSYAKMGYRTLLLTVGPDFEMYSGDTPLIPELKVVSVIAIEDEIRKDCRETMDVFMKNDMEIKVISGDDPATVDAMFTIANIPGERKIISGDELDALQGKDKENAILEYNIFGRMRPNHKELIVETLKKNGKYVAMIGDGVNDVKSLKSAQVGVALESGAGAARGVADMVLMKDSFSALPRALVEGKRTVSGMRDILKQYISRNFVFAFLVLFVMIMLGSAFRTTLFLPTQAAFYAFVSVAIPSFFMTLWAKPTDTKGAILPAVLSYAVPVALSIALMAVCVYLFFYTGTLNGLLGHSYIDPDTLYRFGYPQFESTKAMLDYYAESGISLDERYAEVAARNALLLFVVLAQISQLFFINPICKFFALDGKVTGNFRVFFLTLFLFCVVGAAYYAVDTTDFAWQILQITMFPWQYVLIIIGSLVAWFFVMRWIMKHNSANFITRLTEKWYEKALYKVSVKSDEEDNQDVHTVHRHI